MNQKRKSAIESVHILCLLFIIGVMMVLSSCGQSEKVYTYDSLSESQKAEIDFIMSKSDVWESENCDTVSFSSNSTNCVLVVANVDNANRALQEYYGWKIWYSYDRSSDTFRVKDRIYVGYTNHNSSVHQKEWSINWDENTKKDYLAKRLGQARDSE